MKFFLCFHKLRRTVLIPKIIKISEFDKNVLKKSFPAFTSKKGT